MRFPANDLEREMVNALGCLVVLMLFVLLTIWLGV